MNVVKKLKININKIIFLNVTNQSTKEVWIDCNEINGRIYAKIKYALRADIHLLAIIR